MAVLLFPVLPFFYEMTANWVTSKLLSEALFIMVVSFVFSLPGLPFELWRTFKLEEKYGFNKTTFKLWLSDKIKNLIISVVLFLPLLLLLLYLVEKMGNTWWVWGASIVIVFQLVLLILYPKLVMPLFNTFSPLPAGDLKDRLFALAKKTSFTTNKIEVMDGSKRSGHSNAFFTGFGRFRKVVLFDTLVNQLNVDEVEAVLAHEIGHYKKGHIPKQLLFSFVMVFVSFAIIAWAMQAAWLYQSFGLSGPSFAAVLVILSLYGGLISFWFHPLLTWRSRKNEYQADAYAGSVIPSPKPLVDALKKLTEKNLSNFEPHPLYSTIYYSHPTLKERENALLGV